MKLVHLRMRRPEDDVSLLDGELFMVKCMPYAQHLMTAPEQQLVSCHNAIINLDTNQSQEIEMQ